MSMWMLTAARHPHPLFEAALQSKSFTMIPADLKTGLLHDGIYGKSYIAGAKF
jgi:hypothetical protein